MTEYTRSLIHKLDDTHTLTVNEYKHLIDTRDEESTELLASIARERAAESYGHRIFIRGLIEISNICRNSCIYCGIRRDNRKCERYRLTPDQIISCADEGYELGFRTFVMQGGEDPWFTDEIMVSLIRELKRRHPDCAVTLSLGERGRESFQKLFDAGADRYLLRHETADENHYCRLHPAEMSYRHRMDCLEALHDIGYQTGCGFMVGSPYQENIHIAQDLKFIETFRPEMCGIGPFIPHRDTPFGDRKAGSAEVTCFLLSIIRVMIPDILLPATTALGTIDPEGRNRGILSGANVVMPNLSPEDAKERYMLYNNKLSSGQEAAQNLDQLKKNFRSIGYEVVVDRGDYIGK